MGTKEMRRCVYLGLWAFIHFIAQTTAQEPLFKNYSVENGLPSYRGFSLAQDRDQFIWICTNNGVCRFDGRHVKTFLPQNSPVDYGSFHLFPDSRQRIWVISVFSAPVYYQDGPFHILDSALKKEVTDTRWMVEDTKGSIFFLTQRGTVIKWDGTKDFERIENMPAHITGGQLINDSILVVACGAKIFRITNLQKVEELPVKGYENDYSRFYKIKNNLVIGSSRDGLYRYTDKGQQLIWQYTPELSKTFFCVSAENDSTFWIGSKDGVYIFSYTNNNLKWLKKMLPGKSVFSIIKDNNGNHWISTSEDGVYFLSAINSATYYSDRAGSHISQVLFLGADGYAFNTNADLFSLKRNTLKYQYSLASINSSLAFLKAVKLSANSMLIIFRGSTGIWQDGKMKFVNNPFQLTDCSYYYRKDGSFFIKGLYNDGECRVHRVAGKEEKLVAVPPVALHYKTIFCVDFNNRIWIGRKDTVYCTGGINDHDQKVEKFFEKNVYISDIQCDNENEVWVATKGDGVYCYKDKKKVIHYNTDNGLLTNNCSSVFIDDDDDIWICSENGLNLLQKAGQKKHTIRSYTIDNLLPDNNINSVAEKDGRIYIATNKGLVVFEKKDMLAATSFPVPCYISNVSLKGRDTTVLNNYILKHGTSISISFSTISYNIEKAPTYFYTLKGADAEWNKTTSEKIQFEHLDPGNYTFTVYAAGWPRKSASLSFIVLPPYWERWWFILLEIAATLTLLAGCFYGVIFYKNRQAELRRKMIENDLRSLRAQINPHFIFNALNSIQDFILNHQPRPANYFLSSFSRLIRTIVDNSGKEYIRLEDEISFLELYLELEQLRLGDSFSYEINCDPDIDAATIGIPPMILQPIVENSLVHGLPMKKGEKKLSVYFKKRQQLLHCIVIDNGIGRKNARQYENKKQGASMGLNNITERLQLIAAKENMKWQPIEITDADEHALNASTKVEVFIPLTMIN